MLVKGKALELLDRLRVAARRDGLGIFSEGERAAKVGFDAGVGGVVFYDFHLGAGAWLVLFFGGGRKEEGMWMMERRWRFMVGMAGHEMADIKGAPF